jgi:hypothetical protein
MAPVIWAVTDQTPNTATTTTAAAIPVRIGVRAEYGGSGAIALNGAGLGDRAGKAGSQLIVVPDLGSQYIVAGTKRAHSTGFQHEQGIALHNGRWSVRHDDNGFAHLLHTCDRRIQSSGPDGIEVGIRLIQNQQPGFPKERAGQSDPLKLPAREGALGRLYRRFVAPGLSQDHFVGVRKPGRADDGVRFGVLGQARDILGDCAVEDRDPLW